MESIGDLARTPTVLHVDCYRTALNRLLNTELSYLRMAPYEVSFRGSSKQLHRVQTAHFGQLSRSTPEDQQRGFGAVGLAATVGGSWRGEAASGCVDQSYKGAMLVCLFGTEWKIQRWETNDSR